MISLLLVALGTEGLVSTKALGSQRPVMLARAARSLDLVV